METKGTQGQHCGRKVELGLEVQPMGFRELCDHNTDHPIHITDHTHFSLKQLSPLSELHLLYQFLVKQKKRIAADNYSGSRLFRKGFLVKMHKNHSQITKYKVSRTTQGIKFPISFGRIDTDVISIIQYLLEKIVYLAV